MVEDNSLYSSQEGVLFDKTNTTLLRCPKAKAGGYEVPAGVTSIGDRAFDSCIRLTSVTIPGSVTSIEDNAFRNCTSLISATVPDSVTSIEDSAFVGCSNLTSIYFSGDAPSSNFRTWGGMIFGSFGETPSVLYHYEDAVGFTSPTWKGRPTRTYGPMDNLSTRGQVETGDDVLIGGMVIGGDTPRTILMRGIGAALGDFMDPGAPVSDPVITLYAGSEVIGSNDDWSDQTDPEAVTQKAEAEGAFPLEDGSHESALVAVLEHGAYSVHLSGNGGTGIGLVELYDGSDGLDVRMMNLSTRGWVGRGASIMVPGFVVTENPRRLLIRGVAAGLSSSFSLASSSILPNPVLTLKDADGVTVATNDDWSENGDPAMIAGVTQQVGAFPLTEGSTDAALLIEVLPGVYTAHVSDAGGGEGIALVEVYAAP